MSSSGKKVCVCLVGKKAGNNQIMEMERGEFYMFAINRHWGRKLFLQQTAFAKWGKNTVSKNACYYLPAPSG